MTEPTRPDPVPAPPRAEGETSPHAAMPDASTDGTTDGDRTTDDPTATDGAGDDTGGTAAHEPFTDLERRPVAEHVAVFEAEHARLQRELGTIDQL